MSSQFQKTLAYSAAGGLLAGWALFIGYGLAFEALVMPSLKVPGTPYMSYGQQAVVLGGVAGFLCASGSAAVALASFQKRLLSAAMVFGGCLLTAAFVGFCWLDDIAHWGHDPSAHVLYGPFVVLLPLVISVWVTSLIVDVVRIAWWKPHLREPY